MKQDDDLRMCFLSPPWTRNVADPAVMLWWRLLSAISVANIVAWLLIARRVQVDDGADPARRLRAPGACAGRARARPGLGL